MLCNTVNATSFAEYSYESEFESYESSFVSYTHRHPEAMRKWVDAEAKLGFTWKQKTSLQELWDQCFDIDDVTETDTPEQTGGDAGYQKQESEEKSRRR